MTPKIASYAGSTRTGDRWCQAAPVAEDELVLVSHVVTPDALGREGATAYLGHLLVEPRR